MKLVRLAVFAYVVASSLFLAGYSVYLSAAVSHNLVQFLLSLVFVALSVVIGALNIFVGYFYAFSQFYPANDKGAQPPGVFPKVALAVPACNEDPALVERTLSNLKGMDYPQEKLEFWLLDNSSDSKVRKALAGLARTHGYNYVYRDREKGFKAGSLNNLLSLTKAPFLAVFDADEKLFNPSFLRENIGHFYKDEKLAFVQTDKKARPSSLFANAVEAIYAFFYEHMEPIRSALGMAMYSGSLGIVRVKALRDTGGFPTDPPTPTEDTQWAFQSDMAGWRGLFVRKAYAYGEPVENFSTYVKQQWKYTYGSARILPLYLRDFSKVGGWRKHLNYVAQYVGYPYTSLLIILFAFISTAFVLSNLSFTMVGFSQLVSVLYRPDTFWMDFFPIITNLVNLAIISRFYFGSFGVGLMATMLNLALAFKRSEAALAASVRDLSEIVVTSKKKEANDSFLIGALRLTWVETMYATFFLVLSAFSLLRGDLIGGFWLVWYAMAFYLALVFAYIYK